MCCAEIASDNVYQCESPRDEELAGEHGDEGAANCQPVSPRSQKRIISIGSPAPAPLLTASDHSLESTKVGVFAEKRLSNEAVVGGTVSHCSLTARPDPLPLMDIRGLPCH